MFALLVLLYMTKIRLFHDDQSYIMSGWRGSNFVSMKANLRSSIGLFGATFSGFCANDDKTGATPVKVRRRVIWWQFHLSHTYSRSLQVKSKVSGKSEKYANYLFISADICIRMGFVTCIMGK